MSGIFTGPALSQETRVNLEAIKRIESHGNPKAFNKGSGARGLYQITPIVVKEWNNFHPTQTMSNDDMFDPKNNELVASWYLFSRIPEMLRYYKEEVSVRNILVAYNAGIKYVTEHAELPEETSFYLQKYAAETE
jgi:soluble lytic murein transglycosylase-like protein